MDFWETHSLVFVICLFFFPRITMLLATTYGGGFLYWFGWLVAPRLTVAVIATMLYWQTNIVTVVLTWIWAIGGEGSEKSVIAIRA